MTNLTFTKCFLGCFILPQSDIPNGKPFASKIMFLYDWQNK